MEQRVHSNSEKHPYHGALPDEHDAQETTSHSVASDIGRPCKCPVCGEPFPDRLAYVDHRMRSCFITIM